MGLQPQLIVELLLAGVAAGLLSALVGAGGAFVSVPFMLWCNVKMHHAVGTSAALGYVYLPGLLLISMASITIAPLGARIAHGMDIRPLKRLFAVFLYGVSAYFVLR